MAEDLVEQGEVLLETSALIRFDTLGVEWALLRVEEPAGVRTQLQSGLNGPISILTAQPKRGDSWLVESGADLTLEVRWRMKVSGWAAYHLTEIAARLGMLDEVGWPKTSIKVVMEDIRRTVRDTCTIDFSTMAVVPKLNSELVTVPQWRAGLDADTPVRRPFVTIGETVRAYPTPKKSRPQPLFEPPSIMGPGDKS